MPFLPQRTVCAISLSVGFLILPVSFGFAREVPLQSPIFRTQRLDFIVKGPPPSSYPQLTLSIVTTTDIDGDGNPEIIGFNDPCLDTNPGIFILRRTPGGLLSSVTAIPAPAGTCDFGPQAYSAVPTFGDFDRDGRLDVVSWRGSTLYHQKPDQTFEPIPFSLPLDPVEGYPQQTSRLVSDLNQDGSPDVIVTQPFFITDFMNYFRFGTNLYIFLATGNGFTLSQKILAPADPALDFDLTPVSVQDFTGDGRPDLLARSGSGWEILSGDGAGHLAFPWNGLAVTGLPLSYYSALVSVDMNDDGLADVILWPGGVYLSSGVGRYSRSATQPDMSSSIATPIVGDVDGDGRNDVTLLNSRSAVVYPGRPGGAFGAFRTYRLTMQPQGILLMDWDEDRYPDIVFYGYSSYYYAPPVSLSVFLHPTDATADQVEIVPPWTGAYPMATGDFDGDGHLDLAWAASTDQTGSAIQIAIDHGDGLGGFRRELLLQDLPSGALTSALAVDLNRDGKDDLVTLHAAPFGESIGHLAVFQGQPAGSSMRFLYTRNAGKFPKKAAAADFNQDGLMDLVVADGGTWQQPFNRFLLGGTVSAYLGQPGGGLGNPFVVVDSDPPGLYPGIADLDIGMIDQDGWPDLVILFSYLDGYSGAWATWAYGLGDGRFDVPYLYHQTRSSYTYAIPPPADVNGDGWPDLTISPVTLETRDSLVAVFLGHQEQVFSRYGIGSPCCLNPGRLLDFDGDKLLDLVGIAGIASDTLGFARGTGTGDFLQEGPLYSPSGDALAQSRALYSSIPPAALLGDFDEDGRTDAVVWDLASRVFLLFNRANRLAADSAESSTRSAPEPDRQVDLVEMEGRTGGYDFVGTGEPQGALVFTLALARGPSLLTHGSDSEGTGGGESSVSPTSVPSRPGKHMLAEPGPVAASPMLQSGTFEISMNFGEALLSGDGKVGRSLADTLNEPGLGPVKASDVTLTLSLEDGKPSFSGVPGLERYSSMDSEHGQITFVVPFEQLLAQLTPAERAAMDQGDGTGRVFVWGKSDLYGREDRIPDTDDMGEPTVRSEVREFRFPLKDLRATSRLFFGAVRIGTFLNAPVTLVNHGLLPLEIGEVSFPDPTLSMPTHPPYHVSAKGRAQFSLTYAPTGHTGFSSGSMLEFREEPPGTSSADVLISGYGIAPILQLSTQGPLDFGTVPFGFQSPVQYVTLKNVGDDTLYVEYDFLDPSAQFSFSSHFIPDPQYRYFYLYPNQTRILDLAFFPNLIGPSQATLRIRTDDGLHPETNILLLGNGGPPAPRIEVDYRLFSYHFSQYENIPVGGEGSHSFLIRNTGFAPLHLSAASNSPLFTVSLDSDTVPPSGSTQLTLTYRPVSWGNFAATITLTTDDPAQPTITANVSGEAFEPPPHAVLSKTVIDFGPLRQGDSASQTFDISNTGAGPLHIYSGYYFGSYCMTRTDLTPPITLLPGERITSEVGITVDFDKSFCNVLRIETNDPSFSTAYVELRATFLLPSLGYIPYYSTFPDAALGFSSSVTISLQNTGQDTLRITQVGFTTPQFALDTPLPVLVPPGQSADLRFRFTPSFLGWVSSYVELVTNIPSSRRVNFYLYGYGTGP